MCQVQGRMTREIQGKCTGSLRRNVISRGISDRLVGFQRRLEKSTACDDGIVAGIDGVVRFGVRRGV